MNSKQPFFQMRSIISYKICLLLQRTSKENFPHIKPLSQKSSSKALSQRERQGKSSPIYLRKEYFLIEDRNGESSLTEHLKEGYSVGRLLQRSQWRFSFINYLIKVLEPDFSVIEVLNGDFITRWIEDFNGFIFSCQTSKRPLLIEDLKVSLFQVENFNEGIFSCGTSKRSLLTEDLKKGRSIF